MLQGNKNKLSHRVRVRDNNERKRKVVLYFVLFVECSHLLIVPPPLAFLAVSSGERDGREPPRARRAAHLLKT